MIRILFFIYVCNQFSWTVIISLILLHFQLFRFRNYIFFQFISQQKQLRNNFKLNLNFTKKKQFIFFYLKIFLLLIILLNFFFTVKFYQEAIENWGKWKWIVLCIFLFCYFWIYGEVCEVNFYLFLFFCYWI